ncbi:MAG: Bax inhibitor-1/YccA family protein [Pseudomonadota bacterium]
MNDFNRSYAAAAGRGRAMDMSTDDGLRSFMLGVYNKLALGLLLSGILAFVAGTVPAVTELVFNTPLRYVVQFGPIVLILVSMFAMRNPSPAGSAALYWGVVTLIGLGLGVWVYAANTGAVLETRGGREMALDFLTIGKAFFITASAFGALSLFGYTTKKNLSGVGSFMIMALWGVVGLSLISLFFPPSGMMETIIMAAVLLLSAGLIAWETQELKEGYYQLGGDQRSLAVMTNWGALNFYISFINMFRIILMFLSSRE